MFYVLNFEFLLDSLIINADSKPVTQNLKKY